MAEKPGKGGSITYTGITVGVKNWTLTSGVDMIEITDFADVGVEASLGGIARWNATATANFDATNTADPGDSATLTLKIDGTDVWAGTALIESYAVTHDVAGVAEIVYSFKGNGALTPPS